MKFTMERAELLGALTLADRVAPRRNTIPILGHVLLATQKGAIAITATDMDRVVTIEAKAVSIAAKGTTTVNAASLAAFVRATPDGGQVEAELDTKKGGERLTLRAGRARATLPTLPPADFPVLPAEDWRHTIEVDGKALVAALKRVAHCQCNEETRFYLNGAYLHAHDGALRLVATDGHRMAVSRLEILGKLPDGLPGIIVPRESVGHLQLLGADADAPIEISIAEQRLQASLPGIVFMTRLVEGTFPDYERVIPRDNDSGFQTELSGLASAIARCAAVITGNIKERGSRAVRLVADKSTVQLSLKQTDGGDVEDEVDAQMRGKPAETGFNSAYMSAALGALEGESIDVEFTPGGPILLRDAGDKDQQLQVVMAMRV